MKTLKKLKLYLLNTSLKEKELRNVMGGSSSSGSCKDKCSCGGKTTPESMYDCSSNAFDNN